MIDTLGTLVVTSALLLASPGPAPLALAATGAIFGIRSGIPFLLGILCGLLSVIVLSGTGVAVVLATMPSSRLALQLVGAAYILYVAYRIATAPIVRHQSAASSNAPGFMNGFVFNLLNIKAYATFLALFSQFQLPGYSAAGSAFMLGTITFGVGIVVDVLWLGIGQFLRPVFESPRYARPMRILFAITMLAAVLWVLTGL